MMYLNSDRKCVCFCTKVCARDWSLILYRCAKRIIHEAGYLEHQTNPLFLNLKVISFFFLNHGYAQTANSINNIQGQKTFHCYLQSKGFSAVKTGNNHLRETFILKVNGTRTRKKTFSISQRGVRLCNTFQPKLKHCSDLMQLRKEMCADISRHMGETGTRALGSRFGAIGKVHWNVSFLIFIWNGSTTLRGRA